VGADLFLALLPHRRSADRDPAQAHGKMIYFFLSFLTMCLDRLDHVDLTSNSAESGALLGWTYDGPDWTMGSVCRRALSDMQPIVIVQTSLDKVRD